MVQNSLVKKEEKKTFTAYLAQDAIKNKINEMVGGAKGQQFITAITSAVSANPELAKCDNASIVSAALLGQALDLSPSPQLGQFYLVPYNKKDKEGNIISTIAQFQLGYKGYIQLAIRSGQYKKINVLAIKEGELIKYDPLTEELEVNLIEDEEEREKAKTIGYYAMFEYMNGFKKALYWTKKKMLVHADKYSQAFSLKATTGKYPKVSYEDFEAGKVLEKDMWKYSSYWYKDFDGMAYKTMLRQLIGKWGIMSIVMEKAYQSDMAEITESQTPDYIDNVDYSIDNKEIENIEIEHTVENDNKEFDFFE